MTREERRTWHAQLELDPKAVRHDLPDLTRFMLATGVRIGEALALYWEDVTLPDEDGDGLGLARSNGPSSGSRASDSSARTRRPRRPSGRSR
ncbi:MAG TPA: hypothetical protein VGL47_10755 [Amycolatopsis sp.]|uniref:Tyr recombinase domain-containing protein n=1 Tax=Amycolatopsis nalaikhensis TaxID=715472 RepID=A0ABY8XZK1_9PSEU|nr:hypothetical protein [Amycolatopsis sp. 2-2]WIV61022.1 hypothetical protein QP939_21690 [Amycolatopsis sp. 2-2]